MSVLRNTVEPPYKDMLQDSDLISMIEELAGKPDYQDV
jgi:hypothetical protein